MIFRIRFVDRRAVLGAIAAAVLILLSVPTRAEAASYFVAGRVYSASPPAAGGAAAANPLTGVVAEQLVGAGLVASTPRNLVKVRLLAADDGHELASYITRYDGGYMASFSSPAASVAVRFVVEELATSKQLFYSEPVSLTPPVSIRFLLVNEAAAEIANQHEFAPPPSPPAKYTAIFTRVGNIELATQVGGSTQHLIDPATGLANVPASVASELSIPQYQDAAFGGNLSLFGAFSHDLYNLPNFCYKIRVYPDPSSPAFTYMTDELVKTKYTVDFTTGTMATERVTLGPVPVNGIDGCYRLTPISPANNVFWSFPDLVALWRTAGLNGDYKLEIEPFGLTNPADFRRIPDFTNMTLMLDNVAPVAQILPLEAGGADGPRVYNPGPLPAGPDLTAARLGSFPADYGGTADPRCLIFNLQPSPKYLAFKLTAGHANSRLLYWQFSYERNDGNELVMGKNYDGSTHAMVNAPGARVSSAETSTGGFVDRFLYLDADHLQPIGPPLGGCAYRFVVRAATRTTDGYQYLGYAEDQDLHYVQK